MDIDNIHMQENIINNLQDVAFVESVLYLFHKKTNFESYINAYNRYRLDNILNELEEIRLILENQPQNNNSSFQTNNSA